MTGYLDDQLPLYMRRRTRGVGQLCVQSTKPGDTIWGTAQTDAHRATLGESCVL